MPGRSSRELIRTSEVLINQDRVAVRVHVLGGEPDRTGAELQVLDAHGAGDPVKRLNASLEGLLEKPVAVTRLVPIEAGTKHQGAL